jgi:hypothetical protein
MPQWRKLHTKLIDSSDVNEMPDDFTRLMWVMLFLIVDREGRGLCQPIWIRSKAFPLREDVTLDQVQAAMGWFAQRGMIAIYGMDGREYFEVCSFHRYQNTARQAESNFPANPSGSTAAQEPVASKSGVTQESVASRSGVTQELVASRSNTDIDIDIDLEIDVDIDVEVDESGGIGGEPLSAEFYLYEQVFIEETNLPHLFGGPNNWHRAFKKIQQTRASPEDMRQAIREMLSKQYTIASPMSLVNPTLTVMSRRRGLPPDGRDKSIVEQLKEQGIQPVE